MAVYNVTWFQEYSVCATVEASNEKEAIENAKGGKVIDSEAEPKSTTYGFKAEKEQD